MPLKFYLLDRGGLLANPSAVERIGSEEGEMPRDHESAE
jgi:hypothetical protein